MTTDADKAAIAALTQRMVTGWAYGDADAIANLFPEDGTLILSGVYCDNREAIREYFAKAFDSHYKNTQVTGKPIQIRAITPDAAILYSHGGVLAAGETEVVEGSAIRASWLCVKRDGQWLLAAYQNTPRFDESIPGGGAAEAA
ncbi:SgcJ/EcaC family oxidoreductase [Actinophytocola oryzae]|uniref:Uncharacterized protein (TIGR02246 family) n=1 Tax=Actinophytocola oryzae TaxID=502181 RepID=A0A4R7UWA8_9PSEU|nr:SgcJ/EcaC family oxidoreductase [Actinophytocola oryzae]TDV41068.1 uncharacterized protein (TIGR02246 family) [Actinophytocola oryzae]